MPGLVGVGRWELKRAPVSELLRVAALAAVTWFAFASSWAVGSQAGAPARLETSRFDRAGPVARGLPPQAADTAVVEIGGLRAAATGRTVGGALLALGVVIGPADRVSPPPATPLVAGLVIVLHRGVPVTVADGGHSMVFLARSGSTVAELLAASGVALDPADRVDPAPDALVVAGAVVRIERVADHTVTVREPVAYGVTVLHDPDLSAGHVAMQRAGEPGIAENTYLVHVVDEAETGRELLATREIETPVAEIRRLGTRPPLASLEIDAIIRGAAMRWGADPEQMLRVAWCESRYDPGAYNPGHGDSGLFQFIPRTWAANSVRAGFGGASPFDAVASANVAAMMFGRGQAAAWTCK